MKYPKITIKFRKPRPDFPLFPHATGRWAKKMNGKTEYFGKIADDPKGERALQDFLDQRDLIYAGRQRRVISGALTVRDLVNRFLTWKVAQCDAGEMRPLSLFRWRKACAMVIDEFGAKQAVEDVLEEDFTRLRKSRLLGKAPSEQASFITYIRCLFNFAYNDEQRLIPKQVLFGLDFRPPKVLPPCHNVEKGSGGLFTSDQIRGVISSTRGALRAMILLGINCGFGNNDCATLTFNNLDLETGWHRHPRPKNTIPRRCPLWNETVAAVLDSLKDRPKPADPSNSDLVFITKYGSPYVRPSTRTQESLAAGKLDHLDWLDSLRRLFDGKLAELGMKRKGLSFYKLRHTFRTMGDAAKDGTAIDVIMGHRVKGIAAHYLHDLDDDRLRAVTDCVHSWLFPANSTEKKEP